MTERTFITNMPGRVLPRTRPLMHMRAACGFLLAAIMLATACGHKPGGKTPPKAAEGAIDLREWNFEKDGIVPLDGNWEFYREQFLAPAAEATEGKGYLEVPSTWGGHIHGTNAQAGKGHATYRLRVLLPPGSQDLGIKLDGVLLAADIYIDGRKLASIGRTGKNAGEMVSQRRVATLFFTRTRGECSITMHVSNFYYSKGGILESIRLGTAGQILSLREKGIAFDLMIFGGLAILAIYHLGLFYFRRTDFFVLYFGIFCSMFALRTLFVNEIVLTALFPGLPWGAMLRWELMIVYLTIIAAAFFYHSLYPRELSRTPLVVIVFVFSVGTLLTMALPLRAVLSIIAPFQVCIILSVIYVFLVLLMAAARKRANGLWFLAGYVFVFITVINDVLMNMDMIKSVQMVHIGFFLFIISQAIILSRRYANAFTTIEQRDMELVSINTAISREISDRRKAEEELRKYRDTLEERVRDRTRELVRTNERLLTEMMERKKAQETILRTSTVESLGVFAGGIAHDFNNLLMAVMGNISLAKHFLDEDHHAYQLLVEAENACMRTKDLTQQLLTFSKGGAPIRQNASIEELLREASGFALRGSHVRTDFSIASGLRRADVDTGQISQVIHNLIINALQAMPDGGTIRITAENTDIKASDGLPIRDGEYVRISISDTGPGIPADYINRVFDPYFTTKPSGSGLGLAICYSIVKNHNGFIDVESECGKGATFTIYLPTAAG